MSENNKELYWDENQRDVVGDLFSKENDEMHPDRYGGNSPYETKKVAEQWFNSEQYEGWLLITMVKYLSRFGKKDSKLKEAKKIFNYAKFLLEYEEKNEQH